MLRNKSIEKPKKCGLNRNTKETFLIMKTGLVEDFREQRLKHEDDRLIIDQTIRTEMEIKH